MKQAKLLFSAFFLLIAVSLSAQNRQVKGVVRDAVSGEGVPFAAVVVQGTMTGTASDADGNFSINVPANGTLVFSAMGYITKSVPVEGRSSMNISLEPDSETLSEVVVTAMGISRSEKSIGYAATTVKNDDIISQHATNVTTALAGKVAGMQISTTTTDPGASVNVIIRGYSSINSSNQPLYVVDNIIVGGMGSLSSEDIVSMTVLKGAAATALYGSRAANGAIIITTKQGSRGTDKNFTLSYSGGIEARQVSSFPMFQNNFGQGWNGQQTWIENGSWGPKLDGSMQPYGPIWNGYQLYHEYSAKPDNVKDFFDIGWSHKHNVSLDGVSADQRMNYYLSYSNASDNGIIPGDKDTYTRNAIAMRSSYAPVDWIKISSQVNLSISKTNAVSMFQGTSLIDGLYEFPRDISLVDLKKLPTAFNSPEAYLTPYGITSPYWAIENRYNQTNQKGIFGKLQADIKPFDFLTLTYRYGFNYSDYDQKFGEPQIVLDDALIYDDMGYAPSSLNADGYVYAYYYRGYETNHDFLASFNKSFINNRFNVSAIAGVNINERGSTSITGQTDGLAVYSGFWNLSNGASKTTLSDSQSKRRLIGLYGDVTLGWDDSIFLELTARNDWSSTLPIDNNHYFYPGATFSWIFTNYLPKNNFLSFGKLRAAYGRTGSDAGVYNTNATYAQASYSGVYGSGIAAFPMNGSNAFRRGNSIPAKSLRPEMTTEFEVGANLRFLNGRIGLDAAYYNRLTSDQIFSISIDPSTGYTGMVYNAGDVRNSGIELLLDFTPVQTRDFRWDVSINWAKNYSLVVDLPEEVSEGKLLVDSFSTSGAKDRVNFYIEKGKPYGTYWTYVPTYTPDGKQIVDQYGQPVLSDELEPTGFDANYKWTGGLSTSLTWKNFSLSAQLDVRSGGKMFSRTKNIMEFTGNSIITDYNGREPFVIPNSVYFDGESYVENTTPIYLNDSSYQTYFDDYGAGAGRLFYLVDRSFVKLRNVSLSYNLPKKWIGPLQGVSLSAYVNNALTWTAKDNYFVDPELTNQGTDADGLFGETYVNPACRIWGFNVVVKF
ncbi:MAG: SusC/RagA family TonB-linked outer membrane protein [Bacteroidales bacterium]|nr:SusC/RagA family TonB-linked outer membrane protein [Bacteroidales bacterium]